MNTAPLLRVTVSDNGPGIPPEVLPKVFEPYFTTKDARQGTGLGLNIVQRLVQEGGGVLHVKTEPGAGTAFTVFLPAARRWPNSQPHRMKKILLVDDDALVLELYRKKLEQAGFEVQTAEDGLLAIKALSAACPGPAGAGPDDAAAFGRRCAPVLEFKPALAAVPVVVLTNSFMSEQARAAAPIKISRAVTKGESTPAKMLEIVGQILGVMWLLPRQPCARCSAAAPAPCWIRPLFHDEAREHFLKIGPDPISRPAQRVGGIRGGPGGGESARGTWPNFTNRPIISPARRVWPGLATWP